MLLNKARPKKKPGSLTLNAPFENLQTPGELESKVKTGVNILFVWSNRAFVRSFSLRITTPTLYPLNGHMYLPDQ